MKWLTYLLLLLFSECVTAADFVVVTNPNNNIEQLSKQDLVAIYMGRTTTLSDGQKVLALDQDSNSATKKSFYEWLVNKSTNEIDAYWSRLLFSAKAIPPYKLSSNEEVIQFINNNPKAIGYIDTHYISDKVKVVNNGK
jgi:ABC-type phosphate transport system substrate-binding protein